MKKLFSRFAGMAVVSMMLMAFMPQKARAQDVTVSYQTFYDELSPYGTWVNDAQYGDVWVPNEGGDFRPYGSRGHWVMTDYGNTWVSDDPWGWACYHYGRWTYDQYYGWVWVPGYEWAPAWVSWRFGGGTCGWAPLGPGMSVGVSYDLPVSWWVFVGPQYMYQPNCIHYWRGASYNTAYMRQTTVINNYYVDNGTHVRYNYGPRAEAIREVTHQPVQVYHMQQTNRPGAPSIAGNNVSVYRPGVNRNTVNSARPANVVQAPRQIGRPQAATETSPGRQPQFRQDIQRQTPGAQRQQQPQPANRAQSAPQPQRQQPQPQGQQQPMNRQQSAPQQQRQQPQPQGQQQPMNRQQSAPQQQRQQPQSQGQPQPMNRQQSAPQPQRQQPQPQGQPQFQRQQPQPMNRPQQAPQPQRQQPQPMNRPQQAPQPQRQQQAPQQREEPQHEQPHEGGRR